MPVPNSRRIDLKKAKEEIQQRKGLWNVIIAEKSILSSKYPDRLVGEKFFGHTGNAFLFDRESVLRHFFNGGDPNNGKTDNTHLLVVSGAHNLDEDNFEKGAPTIIIAGVKENPSRIEGEKGEKYEFIASNIADPADEYPPVRTIDEIDKILGKDKSFFIKVI